MEDNIIEKTADKLITNYDNGNLKFNFEKIEEIEPVLNKIVKMEDDIFEKIADKLIAANADCDDLKFENVDKIESVLNKTNSHSHPQQFSFYVNELKGCLGFMFNTYCNFPADTVTSRLITSGVDFNGYNKSFKEFTVQLLKLLHERTNEKKVTNNEWIKN